VAVSAASDPRPIGVFDSGLGGLTAVRELFRVLPNESIVYFGDTARLPYGTKSRDTVTRFSLEIASFLVRQDIKCLLVACATASSYALETLEHRLKVPVVGVIRPAAAAAVSASPQGRIGVLGTPATVTSRAYPEAIAALAGSAVVTSRACPLFVPLIEEGWIDHAVTREVAAEYLADVKAAHPESVILGCTHYPLVAPVLQQILGPGVKLLDSGAEAARALAALLAERGMLAAGPAHHRFYLSDERIQFQKIAESFLGRPVPAITIVDQTDLPWFERTHEASA
jgi:glutamate racemase